MVDYRNLYRSYYSKISENNNLRIEEKSNIDNYFKNNKKREKNIIIKKFIFQTIGATLLILILIIAKNSPSKDVQQVFFNTKEAINKRYEIKDLIKSLGENFQEVEKSIFRAAQNVYLDSVLGWDQDGKKHSFLEKFENGDI